jgi:hypothetical protein
VAAVHHKAEYESYTARALASQWDSPIIVTTSVQFFEILASNRPGALRRLHELPWSMIYIDEVHSCLPTHLWRVTWKWIEELGHDWNCRWLLGSGSLPKLWSVPGLVDHDGSAVPTIISPELACYARSSIPLQSVLGCPSISAGTLSGARWRRCCKPLEPRSKQRRTCCGTRVADSRWTCTHNPFRRTGERHNQASLERYWRLPFPNVP